MAVAYIQEFTIQNRSTENYDFVAEKIGDGPFDGLIAHTAGFDEAGRCVQNPRRLGVERAGGALSRRAHRAPDDARTGRLPESHNGRTTADTGWLLRAASRR